MRISLKEATVARGKRGATRNVNSAHIVGDATIKKITVAVSLDNAVTFRNDNKSNISPIAAKNVHTLVAPITVP